MSWAVAASCNWGRTVKVKVSATTTKPKRAKPLRVISTKPSRASQATSRTAFQVFESNNKFEFQFLHSASRCWAGAVKLERMNESVSRVLCLSGNCLSNQQTMMLLCTVTPRFNGGGAQHFQVLAHRISELARF
jgi:hypothetical protein